MAKAMTKEQQVVEETAKAAKRGAQRLAEGEPMQAAMEVQELIPAPLYAYAAGASILASMLLFFLRKNKDWALFVGQWAPTFLAMGAFFKLLRPSREQQA